MPQKGFDIVSEGEVEEVVRVPKKTDCTKYLLQESFAGFTIDVNR